jgi:hypothetical protein
MIFFSWNGGFYCGLCQKLQNAGIPAFQSQFNPVQMKVCLLLVAAQFLICSFDKQATPQMLFGPLPPHFDN